MGDKLPRAGVETRIIEASMRALADGYKPEHLRWYVTIESVIEFQRCWTYMEKRFDPYQQGDPLFWGGINGVMVYTDPNLKGKIAELRPIEGGDYAILLDFETISG